MEIYDQFQIFTDTRLIGGTNVQTQFQAYRSITGRVEVSYNDEWGTVCDNNWDIDNAYVVCRSLGYLAARYYYSGARYGQGVGHVWLDQVYCTGTESTIADCSNTQGWGNNLCTHSQDAGVVCTTGIML